jgi:hypothetical protein
LLGPRRKIGKGERRGEQHIDNDEEEAKKE